MWVSDPIQLVRGHQINSKTLGKLGIEERCFVAHEGGGKGLDTHIVLTRVNFVRVGALRETQRTVSA